MSTLHARDVSAGYGDGPAVVRDVTLQAEPGTTTTLLGPNGCGKSTLLKAMSRLLIPSAGQVTFGKDDIHGLGARKSAQMVSLLPQHPSAPAGLTVGELVSRGRNPHRRLFRGECAHDKQAIDEAMEATSTSELVDRDIATLSGGQRQRVWLAMALAQDTPVLLLDEPTTFLDPAHALEILTVAREQARAGKTVVMVLHDLFLAGQFSDRVVLMRDGEIIAQGTPAEALNAEVIEQTYNLRVDVWDDPEGDAPIIVPRAVSAGDAMVAHPVAGAR